MQFIIFLIIFVCGKQLLPQNHSNGNSSPWSLPVFMRVCFFSLWKSNIGCRLSLCLALSVCCGSVCPPPASRSVWSCTACVVWCKPLVWFDGRYVRVDSGTVWELVAMFAAIERRAFKLTQYHHQTQSLCGGLLKAQCQFPPFLCCYLSTFYLILPDSTIISHGDGRMQDNNAIRSVENCPNLTFRHRSELHKN